MLYEYLWDLFKQKDIARGSYTISYIAKLRQSFLRQRVYII